MIEYAFIATRCDTFGDDTSFFVLMHMFFWIYISKATRQFSDTDVQMIEYAFIATRCDAVAYF